MSRSLLGFASALLLAALVGGWLLANDLVLCLLGLHDAPRAWNMWWRYVQAMELPQFAPYAIQITLSGAIGFGLPLLVWLRLLIPLFKARPESLHGEASFAILPDLKKAGRLIQCMGNGGRQEGMEGRKNIRFVCAFVLCIPSLGCNAASTAPPAQDISEAIGLRPSYDKCGDASGGVTVAMLNCDATEYNYQNKRLNKAYKSLLAKLSESEQAQLRDEEKKWIAYRDFYCAPDPDGGTSADVGSSGCLVEETAKQATALEVRPGQPAVLTQYEGDKNGLRPSYIKCIKVTHGIGSESQSCTEVEYSYQDMRLNKVYQSLIAKLSESEQAKLRADEKIWVAFRNTHCGLVPDDAKEKRSALNDCLVEETAKRAFALEARLSFL